MTGAKLTIIPKIRRVVYATYANFPTTNLAIGDLAYATDRLVFYRWSGSAWQAVTIHSSSGAIGAIPTAGDLPNGSIYHDTTNSILKQVQAGSWVNIAASELAILTTRGDILYRNATIPARLAKGAAGTVLTMGADDPAWATPGGTQEIIGIVTGGTEFQTVGEFQGYLVDDLNDEVFVEFTVPDDFTSLTSLYLEVLGRASDNLNDWNYDTDYGGNGENYNTHSETEATVTGSVVFNKIELHDISGVFSSLSAGDKCAFRLYIGGGSGGDALVLGIRGKYA